MIPDRNFLRRCAQKNNLELPRELEDWLLVHFEDEPYENFNTASIGSSPFPGVSSLFTGVSDIFTSLFRRASLFPGVSPKLLIILVSTRFFSALLFFLVFLIPVTRSS